MLICPNCHHKFTHTTIQAAIVEEEHHDPFHVILRPQMPYIGEERVCPKCNTKSLYQRLDLLYSEGG
jgi:hypothetical protein